jgi:hypothetical protein
MTKRWTLEDDKHLAVYHQIGADYVAYHDLGHHGRNAGTKRIAKLKETGVWDKLIAAQKAEEELYCAHTLAFSRCGEARSIAAETLAEREGVAA